MKIVVDTNIIFSALLNSNSRIAKILMQHGGHFSFYSCEFLRIEIAKHRRKLLKLSRMKEEDLLELESLVTRHITFINEKLLPVALLQQTHQMLEDIDPNDTPFVATAKHLKATIWTGDLQLYNGLKAKGYKQVLLTAELSALLNKLEG